MEEVILNINYQNEQVMTEGPSTQSSDEDQDMDHGFDQKLKYMKMIREIAAGERTELRIELDDVIGMDELGPEFALNIQKNAYRYIDIFSKAVDSLIPTPNAHTLASSNDPINTIIGHRLLRQQAQAQANPASRPEFPPSLLRRYAVYFTPSAKAKSFAVRQVKSSHIGSLIKLRGVCVRVSEVKPLVSVCTYTCDKCGFEIYQEVTTSAFTPLVDCPSDECRNNNTKGELFMQTRGSKFIKFQEMKLQELTDQVPMGHIPRSMTVQILEGLTRTVNPGDQVSVSGIFMPRPYTGFQAIRAGLLTDTYLYAMNIDQTKQKYSVIVDDPTVLSRVLALSEEPNVYTKLARSIAPEIYGHEDVKKALLLMMAGGVARVTEDGMKIRGDMNICLMGDPGVAKSQLLKYIARTAPRGVYTTGKGSSGVGLTAAVTKDPVTGEMILEGGALVLGDNGICCIDEFDKMDEYDRTAIHEVMEQQTISIAKAGITTTLNARTSILAAANPLHGRYNPKRSPKENINLPYALLSRFDIMFLMLDRPDADEDSRLADHVLHVHRTGASPTPTTEAISPETLRQYIAHARQFSPWIPTSLVDYITGAYVSLRTSDVLGKDFYTTPRTLMAIIRMSQALARLRFSDEVAQADIDESMRLLDASRASVLLSGNAHVTKMDPVTKIYSIIRDLSSLEGNMTVGSSSEVKEVLMESVRDKVRAGGFSEAQLQETLRLFDQASVWSVSGDGRRLVIYN